MKVRVPENLGGELKVLPEGTCKAVLDALFLGTSSTGNPKATARYIVTSELYEDPSEGTSVGENVLETFSLQPQALFNINGLYKAVTGKNIPQGDYELDEFLNIIEEAVKGQEFNLVLETEIRPGTDEEFTKVSKRSLVK